MVVISDQMKDSMHNDTVQFICEINPVESVY